MMPNSSVTNSGPEQSPLFEGDWISEWERLLAHEPELAHCGRWCNVDLVLRCDGREATFHLVAGKLSDMQAHDAERIVLDGADARWRGFLQQPPPPHHQSVLGMDRRFNDFTVLEGRESLIRHLRALSVVFSTARSAAQSAAR